MTVRRRGLAAGLAIAAVVGMLVLQLWQPPEPGAMLPSDGTMEAHVDVPGDVREILEDACADCHSDRTRWPWYARISPVSWWVVGDVRHGRSNLDFDAWSRDPVAEPTPRQRVEWMCRSVQRDEMPPRAYRLLHREARLKDGEKMRLCEWSRRILRELGPGGR